MDQTLQCFPFPFSATTPVEEEVEEAKFATTLKTPAAAEAEATVFPKNYAWAVFC